jgi:predicted acyl esterase
MLHKVGMYGKSYDGVTGLTGANHHPAGLKAVVAQEPVYDLYRYLYGDGIRRFNSVLTPALYDLIDLTPGSVQDDPSYNADGLNDSQRPGCPVLNLTDQGANDDHYSDYWRQRNLIPAASGSTVPLFLTQGLTENNTVADGLAQYLDNHGGYERAWLGPWEHVRGNERDDSGRLKMGRAGFFASTTSSSREPRRTCRTRRSRCRRATAGGVPSSRGRPRTRRATPVSCVPAATPTTARARRRRRATQRACGRSRPGCPTTLTCPARAGRSSTWRPRGRTRTSSSTSTTATSSASAREDTRPVVGRLEDPSGPPDRGARDRRE